MDLRHEVAPETIAALAQALGHYGVLVFRDQHQLTPKQQIAFSRAFGVLEIHVQKKISSQRSSRNFHRVEMSSRMVYPSDSSMRAATGIRILSYLAEPSLGSLLHSIELPDEGGDTLFGSLTAAYAALDDDLKAKILHLTAVHDYNAAQQSASTAEQWIAAGTQRGTSENGPTSYSSVVRKHERNGGRRFYLSAKVLRRGLRTFRMRKAQRSSTCFFSIKSRSVSNIVITGKAEISSFGIIALRFIWPQERRQTVAARYIAPPCGGPKPTAFG